MQISNVHLFFYFLGKSLWDLKLAKDIQDSSGTFKAVITVKVSLEPIKIKYQAVNITTGVKFAAVEEVTLSKQLFKKLDLESSNIFSNQLLIWHIGAQFECLPKPSPGISFRSQITDAAVQQRV